MMSLGDSGIDSGSSPEVASSTTNNTGLRHNMQQQQMANMSRTHQYRKVMKPLLERKRRARINHCLDELKDLMVGALQTEGENVSKLEKADILELTVRHLRRLKQRNALGLTPQATYASRFRAGYAHCAQEVSRFMTSVPEVGQHVSARLLAHLGGCLTALETLPPSSLVTSTPAASAASFPASSPLHALFLSHHLEQLRASQSASPSEGDVVDCAVACSVTMAPSGRKRASTESESDVPPRVRPRSVTACGLEDKAWRPW